MIDIFIVPLTGVHKEDTDEDLVGKTKKERKEKKKLGNITMRTN